MIGATERGLKFDIEPADTARFAQLEALGQAESRQEQRSIYFDTAKGRLRKEGLTLQVRHTQGAIIQTLTSEGPAAAGVFDRAEWEAPIQTPEPDVQTLAGTPAEGVLARRRLKPAFEVSGHRTRWIRERDSATVEIVLDEVLVSTGEADIPVCELELKLKQGSAERLFQLAHEINRAVPLRLGVYSKSARGFMLLDQTPIAPAKAEHIKLPPQASAGDAFKTIATSCIRHFRLNEPLIASDDGAALHQARVGLRRLRSAISVFRPILVDASLEDIRRELRWIAATLGEARDLDVFLARLRRELSAETLAEVDKLRSEAFARVHTSLASERFRWLMIEVTRLLAIGDWIVADHPNAGLRDGPAEAFARLALDKLWRRLKREGRQLSQLDDDARHEVRIVGKKMRYSSEFFASLFSSHPRKRTQAFTRALDQFQEQLGAVNDLATGANLIERFLSTGLGENVAGDKDSLIAAAGETHARLLHIGPFWRN